jgi:hypothetical protein
MGDLFFGPSVSAFSEEASAIRKSSPSYGRPPGRFHTEIPDTSAQRTKDQNVCVHIRAILAAPDAGACEAAVALEGVLVLNLAPEAEILTLGSARPPCAMLTRLAHMGERPGPAQIGQRARER